jgi:hypothetical protein
MLTSFIAQNFRLFSKLEIRGLSRVNLFVGKNNAGKSALLEAIEVYTSNASARTLLNLVEAREETWGGHLKPTAQRPNGEGIRHLFKDHQLPPVDSEGFVLGPLGRTKDQIRVTTAAFRTIEVSGGGTVQRQRLSAEEYQLSVGDAELDLVAVEEGRLRRLLAFNSDWEYIRRVPGAAPESDGRRPLQVVPTRNMARRKVAMLWDSIGLTTLAQDVINGLQIVEPSIDGIGFVESPKTDIYYSREPEPRIPIARVKGQPEPLPLRSMGDGITRLFHITLALANAKNGVLLVDEFENGLHWSVQKKVWQTVFRLAEELNVQVFASTHSRDCIKAFQQAWQEQSSSGAFFRLENEGNGNVSAQPYSLERLTDAEDVDAEVR